MKTRALAVPSVAVHETVEVAGAGALNRTVTSAKLADCESIRKVGTIQDPDQRVNSTTRTLEIWLSADREGAAAWIANSNLPDETKKKLLGPGH